jgi:ABC-type phosphate/phosphonate transport system substrate-binding protein
MMITSFRMYNAVPGAQRAWSGLFERIFEAAKLDIRIDDWSERPLRELWERSDLCCAFMCGLPFVRTKPERQSIAAPVPLPPQYEGIPRYRSEFLVREESGWRTLEDTFGSRIGWTSDDSQSGFNAPRAHLATCVTARRRKLYGEVRGPLGSVKRAVDALHAREVDIVALDSFWLDLCRHHDPERVAGLRCVARTAWAPIPLLVAGPGIDSSVVDGLRERLTTLHEDPTYRTLLDRVLVARFAPVPDYRNLEDMARYALECGYDTIR